MKKILILLSLASVLFAWDCTEEVKNVKLSVSADQFCRNYATYKTVLAYDKTSIKMGQRVSYNDTFGNAIIDVIQTETNQCYETCMLAHSN